MIGKTFGRLKVISFWGIKNNSKLWKCVCSCNNKNTKITTTGRLNFGQTKSCGCLSTEQGEKLGRRSIKHGFNSKNSKATNKKFYNVWKGLRRRCDNKNAFGYVYYGGRGITYDPRWEEFAEFKNDMYFSYLYAIKQKKIKKPSIERKDVDGNYCKENCIWIPMSEQSKNRRKKVKIKIEKEKIKFKATSPEGKESIENNQRSFAKEHNLYYANINNCLKGRHKTHKGWKFEYI